MAGIMDRIEKRLVIASHVIGKSQGNPCFFCCAGVQVKRNKYRMAN